jgi:arginase family enzyme
MPYHVMQPHTHTLSQNLGMLAVYPNLGILWVDAHADINTPQTSESGNMHGMEQPTINICQSLLNCVRVYSVFKHHIGLFSIFIHEKITTIKQQLCRHACELGDEAPRNNWSSWI